MIYDRDHLIDRLLEHEGLRLKPYTDTAGKLTIGIGRNLTDRGITREEATRMCAYDIKVAEQDVLRNFPQVEGMDGPRQTVLVEMCFNMGWPALSGFRRMLKALRQRDYDRAADEMLNSRWAAQVGQRARTLAQIMRMGEYQ